MDKKLNDEEMKFMLLLLETESLGYKKARMYSHILTDQYLAEQFKLLSKRHKERFEKLYDGYKGDRR